MNEISRRDALRFGALAAAIPSTLAVVAAPAAAETVRRPAVGATATAAGTGTPAAAPVPMPVPASWRVKPFDNSRVRLTSSLFTAHRDEVMGFVRGYPVDNMLFNFRANAGLDTLGAQPPGGWDTPTGNLRGHYTGHFMSAHALAYAGTGDPTYKDRLDSMVAALGECQQALDAQVGTPGGPSHAGYLAAYPETQYVELESFATYPTIWAPWYTCHMIMRGLLDAYLYTGNEQAFGIVRGMADWAYSRLGHLPRTQLDRMWKIYIAGEYNAMNDLMAELYALTGNENDLVTARCFDNTYLLDDAIQNIDALDGEHANQHIPQFLGYLNIYDQNDETDYYTAAKNFWDMVVPHRTYTDGGMAGSGEFFGARDVIVGTIQTDNAETCPVYNMLKLSRQLFFHTADPKYMEYYERAVYGQILASRKDAQSTTNPLLTYFVPMKPGNSRSYGNLGTCCGGTGLETHAKFQDSVYFRSVDDQTLYVNLYIPSVLSWPEKGVTIEQTTAYPTEGASTLLVRGGGRFAVSLRVPYWVVDGYTVRVNGVRQHLSAEAGGYVTISRRWSHGDRIEVAMPLELRIERALDDVQTQSITYGPVPLVIASPSQDYLDIGLYQDYTLAGRPADAIVPGGTPMTFTTNGYTLVPFYTDDTNPYHAYFKRAEPTILFGGQDSGVPNRQATDGSTFLDALWARAPFRDREQFVRTAAATAEDWSDAGLLSASEARTVLDAAGAARFA